MERVYSQQRGEIIRLNERAIKSHLGEMVRRTVEDITEVLWGTKVSPGTISNQSKKVYEQIEAWRNRLIEESMPYVYLDGIVLKRFRTGEVGNVSVLVAISVSEEGYRKILGVCEGVKEDKAGWSSFLFI